MKYKGRISDPKDLVTKEYVDSKSRTTLYHKGSTAPSNTNEFWLNITDGTFYVYDSAEQEWIPFAKISDKGVSVLDGVSVSEDVILYLTSIVDSTNFKTDEPLSSTTAFYTDMLTKEVN